jgi:glycosyltransferase involved in cell wall biosynthesis
MNEIKKVLIIAFPFPPFGVGETVRVMKFIKYLPENGWIPVVITLPSKKEVDFSSVKDLIVYRVPFFKKNRLKESGQTDSFKIPPLFLSLKRWFMIPDSLMWWIPFAANAGVKIAKKENIDVIYSVSPNHSCHIVAMKISKKLKIPWVADFKDPWVTNPFEIYPTILHKKLNFFLEKQVINSADKIITVSEPIKEDFINRYPNAKYKVGIITNGFDSDDFKNLKKRRKNKDKIIITHTGSLYGQRNPITFLKAISLIKMTNPLLAKKLKIIFVGKSDKDINFLATKVGVQELVEVISPVSYKESLQYQVDSDILLLITGPGKGTVTGKVFEYMAISKPIIALTDENSYVASILRKTNLGFISNVEDINKISNILIKLCEMIKNKKLPKPNKKEIKKYDRKNLTKELAKIFDELIS